MEIEGAANVEPTAVDLALDAWSTALDHLVKVIEDGALDGHDDAGLLDLARRFEQTRNRTCLVDHQLVSELDRRRVAEQVGQPSTRTLLAWLLRIGRGEAARRVQAAEQLSPRRSMIGEVLAPLRPALAAVAREGLAGAEQVDICLRAVESVDRRGFDPADVGAADELLAQFATTFPPTELRQLAGQVVERIDPDGSLPDDELQADRRHLAFRRTRDGMWAVEGRLTGAVGAKLRAVLTPLAAPRTASVALADGRQTEVEDPRHHGQRTHDALEEVCDRLLRSGTLPDTGGTPATVVVTINEASLRTRRGAGTASDGTRVSADAVLGLADEAEVYLALVDTVGVVLDLGRTRRLATRGQTAALVARDGGCSFPGCDRPPEWCERHHVVAWIDGGRTDLGNLTLLCAYHHHNFAGRGWTCRMVDGLPAWAPPRWLDRHQRPIINERLLVRHPPPLRC